MEWGRYSYPCNQNLKQFLDNLNKRLRYINKLIAKVRFGKFDERRFWLPGFFNQKNFITTLLAIVARSEKISLERLRIKYTIKSKDLRMETTVGRRNYMNNTF